MEINALIDDILNNTGIRETLRKSTPEIARLESLDGLRDLKLVSLKMDGYIALGYEATATPDLYPHVRARLIDAGVVSKSNVLSSSTFNRGQNEECESLQLGFHGAAVQAFLRVYNPNYDRNNPSSPLE